MRIAEVKKGRDTSPQDERRRRSPPTRRTHASDDIHRGRARDRARDPRLVSPRLDPLRAGARRLRADRQRRGPLHSPRHPRRPRAPLAGPTAFTACTGRNSLPAPGGRDASRPRRHRGASCSADGSERSPSPDARSQSSCADSCACERSRVDDESQPAVPYAPATSLPTPTAHGALYLRRLRQRQLALSLFALIAFGDLVGGCRHCDRHRARAPCASACSASRSPSGCSSSRCCHLPGSRRPLRAPGRCARRELPRAGATALIAILAVAAVTAGTVGLGPPSGPASRAPPRTSWSPHER